MQIKPQWLLIPPALALVLFLGPFRDFGQRKSSNPNQTPPAAAPKVEGFPRGLVSPDRAETQGLSDPSKELPNLWQLGSTLAGVLLVGAVALMLIGRSRRGATSTRGASIAQLRQSLRLSARQRVHVVQFDQRLLLLGECEHSLVVLAGIDDPSSAEDTAAVLRRDDEEGAVPRDLIVPTQRSARLPTSPKTAAKPLPPGDAGAVSDFKKLLSRARVAAGIR